MGLMNASNICSENSGGACPKSSPSVSSTPARIAQKADCALKSGFFGQAGGGTDNAFIFSVIESYRHNDIYPGKYVNNLLGKLKAFREGTDMTSLVPCYSGL